MHGKSYSSGSTLLGQGSHPQRGARTRSRLGGSAPPAQLQFPETGKGQYPVQPQLPLNIPLLGLSHLLQGPCSRRWWARRELGCPTHPAGLSTRPSPSPTGRAPGAKEMDGCLQKGQTLNILSVLSLEPALGYRLEETSSKGSSIPFHLGGFCFLQSNSESSPSPQMMPS